MRSSRATPPIGNSTTSGVSTPKARAVKMCPNSCSSTRRENQDDEDKAGPRGTGAAGDVAGAENPDQKQKEGDVDADGCAGDRSDIQ